VELNDVKEISYQVYRNINECTLVNCISTVSTRTIETTNYV